jgi:hypothetical protein
LECQRQKAGARFRQFSAYETRPLQSLVLQEDPMSIATLPSECKRACKLTFRVQRCPYDLSVAVGGEASFDRAEVISAQLLRIPLDGCLLVVLDLADLTCLSSLAMGGLVEYHRGFARRGVEVRLANVHAHVWLARESAGH